MLSNAQLAELLACAAETARMPARKALRRASRRALLWPAEVAELLQQGSELTELPGIGPYLQKVISGWMADPPPIPEPPEIRQHFLTFTAARAALQKNPAWLGSVRGDLQMHTVWSDGEGTVAEMAEAAIERGYRYISITDHTQGLKIAGGIGEAELRRQAEEIGALNERFRHAGRRFMILRSAELNLNPAGEGDMPSAALAELDLVLGCFHSALRKKEDQTARYLVALRNPQIHILGHPRGRIYNFRLGLSADWQQVFDLAAALDKAVEIDAYPDRQDLSLDLLRIAKKSGCRISFGTDSHGPSQLRFMEYAAAAALLAGISRERILNFLPVEGLLAWAQSVRGRARAAA